MRLTAALIVLTVSALCLPGCGGTTVYDGSASFYDQHPGYRDEPAYMHPSDDGSDPDPHPFRPY